jgi:hypothetical protein
MKLTQQLRSENQK